MPPLPPPNLPLLGCLAAQLLYDQSSWVHRRKEVVRILDDTWFRRQISIDYQLPDGVKPYRTGPHDERLYALPITLLRKSPPAYLNFDMRDEGNEAMSLMTREQNALVSHEALRYAGRQAAVDVGELPAGAPLPDSIDKLLGRVAHRAPVTAAFAVRELSQPSPRDGLRQALFRDDRFMWLVLALAEHSVVMFEVTEGDGRRRLVKLSYAERNLNRSNKANGGELARGGLRPYVVFIDSPFIVAGTYHFELEAPTGLQVIDTAMREYGFLDALSPRAERALFQRTPQDPQHEETAAVIRRGTRTHLYAPDAGLTDRAEVDVLLRVQREGFISGAAWIATGIAALLALFLLLLKPVVEHQGVVPSLLLLFPGVIATSIGRAGDHQLTIRLLSSARRALLLSALCVFAAATGLALSRTGDGHNPTTTLWGVWIIVTLVSTYCAALLQLARHLPKRPDQLTPTDRRLGRAMRPLITVLGIRLLRGS